MIKTNIKMRVTPEQSAKVQEICFNRGFEWVSGEKKAIYINEPFITISSEKDIRWIGKDRESIFIEAKEKEIDPELFIRTNGSCIEKEEFTYPMWFKHKNLGQVVRFDGLTVGEVVYGFENWLLDYAKSDNWTEHTDNSVWEQVPNPDLATDKEIEQTSRGDGGSTNYYELPKGATELRHLIRHKKMSHSIGEIFCAIYRLNDNGEYLRNLKKAKFYIDSEIEDYEKENNE